MLLDDSADKYIKEVLKEYNENPECNRYDNVILPPYSNVILPKLFIWCPVSHYNSSIPCPIHGNTLQTGMWTDDSLSPKSVKNPRLSYDLFGNVIIIQRYYICDIDNAKTHRYTSTDKEIMLLTPEKLRMRFVFEKYHDSIFSINLITFIFEQVKRGVNFTQMAETIAMFNNTEHSRLVNSLSTEDSFLAFKDSILFSFPSSDKLINLFLDIFNKRESFYKNEMEKISLTAMISTDHTFKIGKPVGYYREDNKFIRNFGQVFIVLNENHEILARQLCQTASHVEVEDLLLKLSKRITSDDEVKIVIVDNCCAERNFYEEHFKNSAVLLDLFHGNQRVIKEIPNKFDTLSNQFCKTFGLIFRHPADQGNVRSITTPSPTTILNNLESFLKTQAMFIKGLNPHKQKKLLEEIEKLKIHIAKGCLSGIEPGQGTEANERLHRVINRSMITGTTNIAPDLANAVLTVLFHSHNEKLKQERHQCNKKVHVTKPVGKKEELDEVGAFGTSKVMNITSKMLTTINEVHGDEAKIILDFLCSKIKVCYHNFSIISINCFRKDMNFTSLLTIGTTYNKQRNIGNSFLKKNLMSLKLQPGVMNFQNIWDCISEEVTSSKKAQEFFNIVLLDLKSPSEVIKDTVIKYIRANTERFNCLLTFKNSDIIAEEHLDVILVAVADILKQSIVLVVSDGDMFFNLYSPLENANDSLVYFGRDDRGFYCTTTRYKLDTDTTQSIKCNCGRFVLQSCEKGKNSRCPCVIQGVPCKDKCTCKSISCGNIIHESKSSTLSIQTESSFVSFKSCRCGTGRKNKETAVQKRCGNFEGKPKTRCPCFNNQTSCGVSCECKGCGNKYGRREVKSTDQNAVESRKRRLDTTLKRLSGKAQVDVTNDKFWTELETTALTICYNTMEDLSEGSNEDIYLIYDMLATSGKLNIKAKSKRSIACKLEHLKGFIKYM